MQRLHSCAVAAAVFASVALSAAAKGPAPVDLPALLERVGQRVEAYYAHARAVLCKEIVRQQPFRLDWAPEGMGRRIVDELRVEWDPGADGAAAHARVRRRILSVNGRPPREHGENPADACMDPKPVSPEPLEFLLPSERGDYTFTWAGTERLDGRTAAKIDYRPARSMPSSVVWTGDCVSVEVPGQERGRVWVDLASGDVLRLDERLAGRFDFDIPPKQQRAGAPTWMEIERADSSIRYKAVTFHHPDETMILPSSIDSLQIIRNAGVPRLRTRHEFTDYRRFLTSGTIIPPVP